MVLAACSGRHAPPDCAKLVPHLVEIQTTGLSQLPPAEQKAYADGMPAYRAAVMKSCTDDGWSQAAVACLQAATTGNAAGACANDLTADQQTHLAEAYAAFNAGPRKALQRWVSDAAATVKRVCACTDAACAGSAADEYERAMADARKSTNVDVQRSIAFLDGKLVECKTHAAGGSGSP